MGFEIRTTELYGIWVGQRDNLPDWFVTLYKETFKEAFDKSRGYYEEDLASGDPELVSSVEKEIFRELLADCYLYGCSLTEDEDDGPRVISFGTRNNTEIVIGFEIETSFVKPGRGRGGFGRAESIKKKRELTDKYLAEHELGEADFFSVSYEC